MAATWREERPEAITVASHMAERPSMSMVTMFSALSSSSEAMIRFSRSLCIFGRASARGDGAALAGLAAGLFFAGTFRDLTAGFFFAGAFFAAFLAAGFF